MAPSLPATHASPEKRKRSHNEVVKSDALPDELKRKQLLSAPAQKISSGKHKKEKVAVKFGDEGQDTSATDSRHPKERSDRKSSKEEKKAEKAAAKEAKKKEKEERRKRKESKRAEKEASMSDAMDTSSNGDSIAANGTPATSIDTHKIEGHESSVPVTPVKHKLSKLSFNSPAPSPSTVDNPEKKKKKSVKFDSEAATEDGTSRQAIHKAILGRYASAAIVTPEDFASSLDADKPPPSKKVKRDKKKKGGKNSATNGNEGTSREAAILYLLSYHTDKANWKFNKAKQNWILRHLFDVDMIPFTKENGAALKAYIAGLQSKDARERLIGQANTVIKEIEKLNEEKAKREAEKAALDVDNDDDDDEEDVAGEEDEEAIARGKKFARAKLVLASMGDAQAERDAAAFTKPQTPGTEEEDSSESSDESSDDDESD